MVPFWVPADYCAAFPAARPLPADTAMRLPFPTVFACFAQPWKLPPHPDTAPHVHPDPPTTAGTAGVRTPDAATSTVADGDTGGGSGPAPGEVWPYTAMLHGRGRAHRDTAPTLEQVLLPLQAAVTDRARLPTPLQVAADLGAQVDGLILTAHPDGSPRDEFAWCLTIPHPWSTTLARVTVPASRRRTAWARQIDNIIAAIALSAWHPTAASSSPEPGTLPGRPRPVPPTGASAGIGVRVLDIDATSPPRPTPHTGSGSASARSSHLRRGHWRRQRVGTGRHTTRWTWVRPTTVNPAGTPTSTQVYRLPAAAQT